MNWVDYFILGVVLLSGAISLLRGFTREALSLAGWVIAIWLALAFAPRLAGHLVPYVSIPEVRLAIGFVVILVATLVATALVNLLVGRLVNGTGLGGTDRMLGLSFGMARGVFIVAILVLLGGLTTFPDSPWWRDSLLVGHFQAVAVWLRGFLPQDIASAISY